MKNDQMQQIRMCIQTYFNLYGVVPDAQEMREWLGASYDETIMECMEEVA